VNGLTVHGWWRLRPRDVARLLHRRGRCCCGAEWSDFRGGQHQLARHPRRGEEDRQLLPHRSRPRIAGRPADRARDQFGEFGSVHRPGGLRRSLAFCAAGSAVSPVRSTSAHRRSHVKPVAYNLRLFLSLLLVASYAVCGATLLAQGGGGLQWLPFAFILAVTIAATNAWILLVEVLR